MSHRLNRVAFYSHDTQGLGHFRRNLALSRTFASGLGVEQLLLSGAPEAGAFELPPRTDVLVVPPLAKVRTGAYRPRNHVSPLEDLVSVRRATLAAAVGAYRPDLLVVDKAPSGIFDELLPALRAAKDAGSHVVLGLRDVLDSPEVVAAEWERGGWAQVVEEFYDQVWVYGDRAVYDVVAQCALGEAVTSRAVFTGYLGRDLPTSERRPVVLCTAGGGQDGAALLEAFVQAPLPPGVRGVAVCGPYMPPADRHRIERLATRRHQVRGFVSDMDEIWGCASLVVSMAGYNSACDALVSGLPTLLAPRVVPRVEQRIRADAFEAQGVAECVPLTDLTPDLVADWVVRAISGTTCHGPGRVDVDGHRRVEDLAATLLGGQNV